MTSLTRVTIHETQFPARVHRDLFDSLRRRQVNPKFLYDSVRQTQKWLALHQACSPSRTDPDCAAVYERAFADVRGQTNAPRTHLIGLGCGGGQKDTRLLRLLRDSGKEVFYTPCDGSLAMVLTACDSALAVVSPDRCFPFVCDLASITDLRPLLDRNETRGALCLMTFFGMLPNFEPDQVSALLPALLADPSDHLLVSANLAPGDDYDLGVKRILPLYDNGLTRDWLLTFLLDLGIERDDGQLRFTVESDPLGLGLKRVVARFEFCHARAISIGHDAFEFLPGTSIRLFFSYRHTPDLLKKLLAPLGLHITAQWITKSGEEGVFLISRA